MREPPSSSSRPYTDPVVLGLRGAPLVAVVLLVSVAAALATFTWSERRQRAERALFEARLASELAALGARLQAVEAQLASRALEPSREPPRGSPAPVEPAVRRGDPKRALLVIHSEWRTGVARAAELGRACPDKAPLLDSELEAVRLALKERAIALEVVEQDRFTEMKDAEIARFGLVIHHNGGWGSALDARVGEALLRAHDGGAVLLFAGDDAAMMLARAPEHLRRAGIAGVRGNGGYPVQLEPAPAREPLPLKGGRFSDGDLLRAMGVLGVKDAARPVQYEKEPDAVVLAADAIALAMTHDGTPVAWLRDAPVGVGVFDLSLRASDVCPVSSSEPWLRELFLLTVDLLQRAR